MYIYVMYLYLDKYFTYFWGLSRHGVTPWLQDLLICLWGNCRFRGSSDIISTLGLEAHSCQNVTASPCPQRILGLEGAFMWFEHVRTIKRPVWLIHLIHFSFVAFAGAVCFVPNVLVQNHIACAPRQCAELGFQLGIEVPDVMVLYIDQQSTPYWSQSAD